MGVYLSSPITDKESTDEQCNGFTYGASSMQGWRRTQEDAHNCIPNFHDEVGGSFFAVYDGHGGSEVAKYCELNFPDFVKSLMIKNAEEDLGKIIKSAFLAFDSTLTDDDVVKTLKHLAGKDEDEEEEEADVPVGHTETDMLKAEADMPLEELLAKYKPDNLGEGDGSGPSGCYHLSPALKGKNDGKNTLVENGTDVNTCSSSSASNGHVADSSSNQEGGGDGSNQEGGGDGSNQEAGDGSNSAGDEQGEKAEKVGQSSAEETSEAGGSGSSGSASGSSGSGSSASGSGSKQEVEEDDQPGSSSPGTERLSKSKAVADIAMANDSDSSEEEEEDMWEDDSEEDDDDDDEEDDEGGEDDADTGEDDIPMMDMTNEDPGSDSGCTACVLLKLGTKLIVGNAGDSRCVLARNGKAIDMSVDHKPEDDEERERIEKAGGKVTADGRVNGGLNLSRAIGDHVYKRNKELSAKEQMITALPDIQTAEMTPEDHFFVIACDGIWNFMSSQEVVDFISEQLKDPEKRMKPSLICEELFDHCLAPSTMGDGTGCDNMTCVIVVFDEQQQNGEENTNKGTTEDKTSETGLQDGDGSKDSLKRGVDNSLSGQSKRVKVDEEMQ